jgi:branched-chain amino acid transport system substrate-binding protein
MGAAQARLNGAETVARMKAMPTDDDCFGPGRIREDGRKITPAYLFEVQEALGEQAGMGSVPADRHHAG